MAGNGGRFSPDDRLTRGIMAQILYNMASGADIGSNPFPDVAANDWFAPAVRWAASLLMRFDEKTAAAVP